MKFNQEQPSVRSLSQEGLSPEKRSSELPIDAHRESIFEAVNNNPSSIIVGETGSGKTTRTPVFLLDAFKDKKIAITSPRVLPARSVSKYVAQERGQVVGGEIGLMTRDQKEISPETRATFMTDGILLSMLRNDPMILDLDIVMVDEAHERTINIDLALGLLKQAQKLRKEAGEADLKIIVTSATIEEEKFANYFDQSPVAKVPGRMYPVDTTYHDCEGVHYVTKAATITKEILDITSDGDILIFMPGEEEILKTIDEIKNSVDISTVDVLPLYGAMNPQDQDKIFGKNDKRKVIVSTNIAETSVTIDGVKHVIDAGYLKQMNYNPETGINALELMPASQANMNQRMGRAGRTAPGSCYRLMSKSDFNEREDFQKPEIMRADLGEVVLRMKDMEIKDVEGFDFIDKPSRARVHSALESLKQLGALDKYGEITDVGKEMARLQLRPDLSRMLVEARHLEILPQMVDVCSMLSAAKQVFIRPKISDETSYDERRKIQQQEVAQQRLRVQGSDPLTLLNVWNKWQESNYDKTFAFEHLLNMKALKEIGQTRLQLLRALGSGGMEVGRGNAALDKLKITQCLLSGAPDALFHSNDQGRSYDPVSIDPALHMLEGTRIFPGSSVFKSGSNFILAMNITKSEKMIHGFKQETLYARNCHNVSFEELKKVLPQGVFVEKLEGAPFFDSWSNTFVQKQSVYIHDKLIRQQQVTVSTPSGDELRAHLSKRLEPRFGLYHRTSSIESNTPFIPNYFEVEYLLPEVQQNNRAVKNTVESYLKRADKDTEQTIKDRSLLLDEVKLYEEVISRFKITTKDDILNHKDDFEMKLEDFVTSEERLQIDNNCPTKVQGSQQAFTITYKQEISKEKISTKIAEVSIGNVSNIEDFLTVELPSFSGRDIIFSVTPPSITGYSSFSSIGRDALLFHSVEELEDYNNQYKKAKAKRLRRHERKAGEVLRPVTSTAVSVQEQNISNEQKPQEVKEKIEPITLDVSDMRNLLAYFRGLAQEKNVRELKDKDKVLERIKEVSGKSAQLVKALESDISDSTNQGAMSELLQSIKAIAKRIGIPTVKAEQLPYLYKHNQNVLIASATRNEVTLDEVLLKKISQKSIDRSLEKDSLLNEEEGDEILIDLV